MLIKQKINNQINNNDDDNFIDLPYDIPSI